METKKKKRELPHLLITDIKGMEQIIEKYGVVAFGIYWYLVEKISINPDKYINYNEVKNIFQKNNVNMEIFESFLQNNLFNKKYNRITNEIVNTHHEKIKQISKIYQNNGSKKKIKKHSQNIFQHFSTSEKSNISNKNIQNKVNDYKLKNYEHLEDAKINELPQKKTNIHKTFFNIFQNSKITPYKYNTYEKQLISNCSTIAQQLLNKNDDDHQNNEKKENKKSEVSYIDIDIDSLLLLDNKIISKSISNENLIEKKYFSKYLKLYLSNFVKNNNLEIPKNFYLNQYLNPAFEYFATNYENIKNKKGYIYKIAENIYGKIMEINYNNTLISEKKAIKEVKNDQDDKKSNDYQNKLSELTKKMTCKIEV
jgi:hypothetical protein